LEIAFAEHDFREELVGSKYGKVKRDLEAECDHGLVVRDLSQALKEGGCRFANDGRRDLFVLPAGDFSGRIAAVFTVRTDPSLTGLQVGITQLLLAGLGLPGNPRLLLVVPAGAAPPASISAEKLAMLNIGLLGYEWREARAVFPGLGVLVSSLCRV
jgi:hypothetical protein